MNRQDFLQWKDNPITLEVWRTLRDTKQAYLELMPALVGDPTQLAKTAGSIETLDYLLNMEVEE